MSRRACRTDAHCNAATSLFSLYVCVCVCVCVCVGEPDSNAPHTIANARAAGIPYVDAYLFPCPKCSKSAAEQVDEMGEIVWGWGRGGREYTLLMTNARVCDDK